MTKENTYNPSEDSEFRSQAMDICEMMGLTEDEAEREVDDFCGGLDLNRLVFG